MVDCVRAHVEEGEQSGLDDLDLRAETEPGPPAGGQPAPVRHHWLQHDEEEGEAEEVEHAHEKVAVLLFGFDVTMVVDEPAALHHRRQVGPALEHVAEMDRKAIRFSNISSLRGLLLTSAVLL